MNNILHLFHQGPIYSVRGFWISRINCLHRLPYLLKKFLLHLMARDEIRTITMFHQHTLLCFHLLHSAVVLNCDYHTNNSFLINLY